MNGSGRIRAGIVLVALCAASGTAMLYAGLYGWTLFVSLPVALGAAAAWLARPATGGGAAALGAAAVLAASVFLVVVRVEGLMCIAMAAPIILTLGAAGGLAVHSARSNPGTRGLAAMLLVPAATLTWDSNAPPPVFEVRTAVDVAAPPEQVWQRVIAFPDLPEPREWFFRTGLAYPQRARIEGAGPGAIRYCEFSTGPFVEPIEVWDEPRRLRFGVTENPPPMREWSPYGELQAKHLHGYLVAVRGQFRLTRLRNGNTLLEGTTWYRHSMSPAQYWRWWSDAIIHRIHLRVLNHVRRLAEQETPQPWSR